jgi:hypothetical protein
MNKILEVAKQALAFVRGEEPAARIHATVGGPYHKGPGSGIIQHHVGDHWIIWNWDRGTWDKVQERVTLLESSVARDGERK